MGSHVQSGGWQASDERAPAMAMIHLRYSPPLIRSGRVNTIAKATCRLSAKLLHMVPAICGPGIGSSPTQNYVMAPASGAGRSKPLTLAAMSLGFGVVQLDVTIVNTALNSIAMSLGGGVSELQWVVSIYTIAFAALILTAGALGDRSGAKTIFNERVRRIHGCFARLCAGADIGNLDRCAGGAGCRRSNPSAELTGASQSRLPRADGARSRRWLVVGGC
jgi:hypothetical protein